MKRIFFAVLSFFCVGVSFAAGSSSGTGRNTAVRCLRIAESQLISCDFANAVRQAELGLSYDPTVADLYYIKAAAMRNLSAPRGDVLETVRTAFLGGDWLGYNRIPARILLADLLCDTGDYSGSLGILDAEPLVYSADAELIRIKNYYRTGTSESLAEARRRINSARRIYPADGRFVRAFFSYECAFAIRAAVSGQYDIPSEVSMIASSYMSAFPDYSAGDMQLETMASFFVSGDSRDRLLRSIHARNFSSPLFAAAAFDGGIISADEAAETFCRSAGNSVALEELEYFVSRFAGSEMPALLEEFLVSYGGTVRVDSDADLEYESSVRYERGRPASVCFYGNDETDSVPYIECDFGTPVRLVSAGTGTEIEYSVYPSVASVRLKNGGGIFPAGTSFEFVNGDMLFAPVDMAVPAVFSAAGIEFFVPSLNSGLSALSDEKLVSACSSVSCPTSERENSAAEYALYGGDIVSVSFYDGQKLYAAASLTASGEFVRRLDTDGDGYMETEEFYGTDRGAAESGSKAPDLYAESVFGKFAADMGFCLHKIQIDRDGDSVPEFTEEYGDGETVSFWDTDGDGIQEFTHIVRSGKNGEPSEEKSVFRLSASEPPVSVLFSGGQPVSVETGGKTEAVIKGGAGNVFWLGEVPEPENLEFLAGLSGASVPEQGVPCVFTADGGRIIAVRAGDSYFCRFVPAGTPETAAESMEISEIRGESGSAADIQEQRP